jgi:hypothetical protein
LISSSRSFQGGLRFVPTQNGAVRAVWNKQYWGIDKNEITYPKPP